MYHFRQCFLLTYRLYSTPERLLNGLALRYCLATYEGKAVCVTGLYFFFFFFFFLTYLISSVLEVINEWMERYWEEDWSGNSLLLEILSSFARVVEVFFFVVVLVVVNVVVVACYCL